MKSIITIALLLSVMTGYGQFQSFNPANWSHKVTIVLPSGRRIDADSMYTALEKAYNRAEAINCLRDSVVMLAKRVEALESRPSLFFHIDSSGRLWNNPTNTFVTGRSVLDSAIKHKP